MFMFCQFLPVCLLKRKVAKALFVIGLSSHDGSACKYVWCFRANKHYFAIESCCCLMTAVYSKNLSLPVSKSTANSKKISLCWLRLLSQAAWIADTLEWEKNNPGKHFRLLQNCICKHVRSNFILLRPCFILQTASVTLQMARVLYQKFVSLPWTYVICLSRRNLSLLPHNKEWNMFDEDVSSKMKTGHLIMDVTSRNQTKASVISIFPFLAKLRLIMK